MKYYHSLIFLQQYANNKKYGNNVENHFINRVDYPAK